MALEDAVPNADMLFAGLSSPARDAVAVTPSDTVNLVLTARALYVAVAGDIKLRTFKNSDVVFIAVPAGSIVPCFCRRVFATGTTATGIVALY